MLAVSKGDEMLAPGTHLSLRVNACFQANRSAGTEGVMDDVIFAGPEQLDWRVHAFRDPRGLDQIIVLQPSAKAASGAHQVRRNVALLDAKRLRHQCATVSRERAGRPHLQLAVFPMCSGALGLKRDMGNEGKFVRRLDNLRRRLERRVHISVSAHSILRRRLAATQPPSLRILDCSA